MTRPFSRDSLPIHAYITNLDMDVTDQCTLRCSYCFKNEKKPVFMSLETAKAAIDWLMVAAGPADTVHANFMGGEPLLAIDMIRRLVPYGKRKARQLGKHIQFSATTNATLLSEDILDFWDQYGSGWMISIDGVPEAQNLQRPYPRGMASAEAVERGARLLLARRPNVEVHATLTPVSVRLFADSFRYLHALGFTNIIFGAAEEPSWVESDFVALDEGFREVADTYIDLHRQEQPVRLAIFDYFMESLMMPEPDRIAFVPMCCGAGRGTVSVDPEGDFWPCHRFDGADEDAGANGQFSMGNLFSHFNHDLHLAFLNLNKGRYPQEGCQECPIRMICGGGCPAANLSFMGSLYSHHPASCRFAQIGHRWARHAFDTLMAEGNSAFQTKLAQKTGPATATQ